MVWGYRPSHELTIFAYNGVNLSVLAEARNSNDFVDPMLKGSHKELALVETVKSM